MKVANLSPPAVSALIINYNTAALTKNCVASLYAQTIRNPTSGATGVEVIVVDNASRPEERKALAEVNARLIFNDENRGYGAALNQALSLAKGEFLLFSNSDTWYFPGALQILLDNCQRLPRCGVVGPRLWWDRDREFLLPPSDPVTPLSFLCDTVVRQSQWAEGRGKRWRRRALGYWQAQTPLAQSMLSGACLLAPKNVVDVCGGFDERFHLYYEDSDWCRRVRRQGYRLYYIPEADVAHLYNQSARQAVFAARQAGVASLGYYFHKHYGQWLWRFLALVSERMSPMKRQTNVWTDYTDLGKLAAPPTFSFSPHEKGAYLLQLSPQDDCLPAIARFFSAVHFSLSWTVWEQLADGEFFAQVFLLPRLQLIGKWRWKKVHSIIL